MKFHGIDMQGKFFIEEESSPSWTSTDDRRFLRDSDDDKLYIGTSSTFVEILTSSQSLPPSGTLRDDLDATYHPLNGDVAKSFTASTYAGDGTDNLRISDNWIKLSDNTAIGAGETAGIRIEYGSITSDSDDINFYYDFDTSKWIFNGGGYTIENIATEEWVTSAISISSALGWTNNELDNRFVRFSEAGDTTSNNTWEDWAELTDDTLGSSRNIYRTTEVYSGFVRSSNWSLNSPSVRNIYSTASNVASTIVERNSSRDIYCNILHGTATSAQYADIAEKYTCDELLPVGTVVGVMPESEYEVEPYSSDFMHGVIGVVSESPAYLMNSESDGLPIALTGKIPIRIIGSVDKGDFLIPVDGGVAIKGNTNSTIDLNMKFATVLEDNLQTEEKLVECIIK